MPKHFYTFLFISFAVVICLGYIVFAIRKIKIKQIQTNEHLDKISKLIERPGSDTVHSKKTL